MHTSCCAAGTAWSGCRPPLFLPDIGLYDLRDFDVPQPILPSAFVREGHDCDWIELPPGGFFRPWNALGPRPEIVAKRYPDL